MAAGVAVSAMLLLAVGLGILVVAVTVTEICLVIVHTVYALKVFVPLTCTTDHTTEI